MGCEKRDLHNQYITDNEFKEKGIQYLEKYLPPNSFTPKDYSDLHSFLMNMSGLTGLLLVLSNTEVEYYGTGFIVKLRRQRDSDCPCPMHTNDRNRNREHAIVTISTAYHVFNESEDEEEDSEDCRNDTAEREKDKRYDEVKEIWDKYKTELRLEYNGTNRTRPELKENKDNLKTLYGHRLVEMDKDPDYDCDWCAIECVTCDLELIEILENRISEYQKGLAKLYMKSQTFKDVNLVVIIGHPHNWAKRITIGQSRKFRTAPEKEILKEVRSRQTWCRYSYDNLTCFGSSGSPIFKWGQTVTGFGYWFGHPHNHSEGFEETDSDDDGVEQEETDSDAKKLLFFGKSTIGVENIY